MATILNETILTFSEAAKKLSSHGKPKHVATLHRWRSRGIRGVVLEAVRVGGQWFTSAEAIQRFITELNTEKLPVINNAAAQADRTLDDLGF